MNLLDCAFGAFISDRSAEDELDVSELDGAFVLEEAVTLGSYTVKTIRVRLISPYLETSEFD